MMAFVAFFRLAIFTFLLTTQHKCVVLVIVESALQPGDLEGGHVAEWSSEGPATASLDGGAGDNDVEYKLILFGPPPFL